jgi:hypothetical protein
VTTASQTIHARLVGRNTIPVQIHFSKETDAQPGVVTLHCAFSAGDHLITLAEPVNRRLLYDTPAMGEVVEQMVSEYFGG